LALLEEAEVVEPQERLIICRDPADDKFFQCGLAGGAEFIVTEDKDILAVSEYQTVRPISAADFIARLSSG
jgi:putative PIN family toxin of toxin-antitoxin system